MTSKSYLLLGVFVFSGSIFSSVLAAERPDLNGSWRVDPSKSDVHSRMPATLQIQQTDDSIHITEVAGDKNLSDITCKTNGHDCKAKDNGHDIKASFYYNGPMLVELDTAGDNVTKKRFRTAQDGTLTIEVMHINPSGRDEKMVLTKAGDTKVATASK